MHRRMFSLLLGVILAGGTFFSALPSRAENTPKPCLKMGIPAYAYPGASKDFWSVSSQVKQGTLYILNPASGPGNQVDPNYTKAVASARKAKVRILGYVDTNYAQRDIADVLKDVDQFRKLYPIDGIFFDQTALSATHLYYYKALSKAVVSRKLSLAFNPGQPDIDQRFVPLANYIITFEGPLSTYLETRFPAWSRQAPKGKFWHLVYDVPDQAGMKQVVQKAKGLPVGVLYVTNRGMPNPWDAVPPYWTQEIQTLCPSDP